MEGTCTNGLVRPGHRNYQSLRKEFGTALGTVSPVIGAFDPRWHANWDKCVRAQVRSLAWAKFASENFVDQRQPPTTFHEALAMSKEATCTKLSYTPPQEIIELARWVAVAHSRFDKAYLDAMRTYGARFDRCIVVTGATHTISLVLKTNHPFLPLFTDDDSTLADMTYEWYRVAYLYPRLVLDSQT